MGKESDYGKVAINLASATRSFAAGDWENGLSQLAAAGGVAGYAYGRYRLTGAAEKVLKDAAADAMAKKGAQATKDAFSTETWILDRAIWIISIVELLFGGASDKGDKFKIASRDFELANRTLADAAVDDRWTEDGADSYDARNAEQMARTAEMAELDLEIAAILKREAQQLKDAKFVLAQCKNGLTAAVPIAMGLRLIDPGGEFYSFMFQMACITGTIPTVVYRFKSMLMDSATNADDVKAVTSQYEAVADGAVLKGADSVATSTVAAAKSTVGEFTTLSAMSGTAAGFSSPDGEGVALLANAPDPQPVSSQGVAEPDTPETEAPPAFTMPTASQVTSRASQASTQAAQFSENASAHMSLISDTVGVIDQIGSMAQSSAPAGAAPAEETAATEDAGDGAAPGTDDMGRAPVEVAAGGVEQAHELPISTESR